MRTEEGRDVTAQRSIIIVCEAVLYDITCLALNLFYTLWVRAGHDVTISSCFFRHCIPTDHPVYCHHQLHTEPAAGRSYAVCLRPAARLPHVPSTVRSVDGHHPSADGRSRQVS